MNRQGPPAVRCGALALLTLSLLGALGLVAGLMVAALVPWRDPLFRPVQIGGVAAAAIGAGSCWLAAFLARLQVDPTSIEAIRPEEEDVA